MRMPGCVNLLPVAVQHLPSWYLKVPIIARGRASDITFDLCPGLTSRIVSDPDPFGQIFDSVMFPIIPILPDFDNSHGILLRKT